MIRHDTDYANMKHPAPTHQVNHHCRHCLIKGGKHSNICPVKNGAKEWHEVNGVEVDDFPNGRYLVETVKRAFVAVYLFNDEETVYLTYDEDTKRVEPLDVIRIARITEV